MPAPTIVGSATEWLSLSGTSYVLAKPTVGVTLANDDHLVCVLRAQNTDWPTDFVPPDASWVRWGPPFIAQNSAVRVTTVFVKKITNAASEPASYTFTGPISTSRKAHKMFVVRGAIGVAGANSSTGTNNGTTGKNSAQYTPAVGNGQPGLSLYIAASEFSAGGSHTPTSTPAGYTLAFTTCAPDTNTANARTYTWIGTKDHVAGALVPSATINWALAAGPVTIGLTFQGSLTAGPGPEGTGFPVYKGNKAPAKLYRMTADGLRTPADVAMVNTGYGSYANMMSGEPREVRRNQAPNPHPVDARGWLSNDPVGYPVTYDATGGRRPATGAKKFTRTAANSNIVIASGYGIGLVDWSGPATRVPVASGEVWTVSSYSKASAAFAAGLEVSFYDAAGAYISTLSSVRLDGAAGTWVRPYLTFTVPAGVVTMGATNQYIYTAPGAGVAVVGETAWMADCLYEKAGTLGEFFSGSYSPNYLTPAWTGAADASVSTLSESEFWWAHRGGSASFPEHSMHAYTQSILRGYQALEISMNRTSDGVWFGLHDQNLDRTSKVTTRVTDANQMTWAQVQSYQNKIGPGADQPYMKWDDLIDVYGGSHILICDPKYRFGDYQTEFLDKCLADIGTDRCIVKGFYDMQNFRNAAQSRGLKTWGYLYNTTIDSDVSWATKSAGWDLLGLNYDAAQSYWDQVLALGKPVVGHICPNEAAVTTARSKGAVGFQCSGTAVINPFPVIG